MPSVWRFYCNHLLSRDLEPLNDEKQKLKDERFAEKEKREKESEEEREREGQKQNNEVPLNELIKILVSMLHDLLPLSHQGNVTK